MSKRPAYVPPVSWKRFGELQMAIFRQLHEKRPIDNDSLAGLGDCLQRLHDIYQSELSTSLPPRKVSADGLMQSAVARYLVENIDGMTLDAAYSAMRVRHHAGWESVLRTYRKHSKLLGKSGIYGINDMPELWRRVLRAQTQHRWDCRRKRRNV